MAEALDWIIVLIAGASLIFAFLAFRMVKGTTRTVDIFIDRGDEFLATFKDQARGVFTPKFMGDTVSHMLTKDLSNKDGSPVNMHQYFQHTVNGYIEAYGPGLKAEFKAMAPDLLRVALHPESSLPGAPNPGRALVNMRQDRGGGLKAAQNFSKAAKKVPMLSKVSEYVEGARAVVGLVQPVKEIIAEVRGLKGDNGQEAAAPAREDTGMSDWGPPF